MSIKEPSKEADVRVDLWPEGSWRQADLANVIAVLQPFGTVSGQLSSDTRGLGLEVLIAFASGAVAAGFFNQVGSSLANLSGRLTEALYTRIRSRFINRQREKSVQIKERLYISYSEPNQGLDVTFVCEYSDEAYLEYFLRNLEEANSAIRSLVSDGEFPFDSSTQFSISAKLDTNKCDPTSDTARWEMNIRRFQRDNNRKLVVNEFYKGSLPAEEWERK